MPLSKNQVTLLEELLRIKLRHAFQSYNQEDKYMPFHTRLIGNDRLALASFVHSIHSKFGSMIYEPIAIQLSSENFIHASTQQIAGVKISSQAHRVIQNIIDNLTTASSSPDKHSETEAIRKVCQSGDMDTVNPSHIDLKLVSKTGTIYLIDLKTVKPNKGNFRDFKRTLLEWVAATLAIDPTADVQTIIAIPYNPYEPKPYARWTIRGMLDLENELKVANEFWDLIGGEGAYEDLLDIFERVGIELRPEIDAYFARYTKAGF